MKESAVLRAELRWIVSDHHQVERVGAALAGLVGGAAGLPGDRLDHLGLVEVDDLVGRVEVLPVDLVVVDLQPRYGDEEGEADHVVGADHVHVEGLGALVEGGEHETGSRLARGDPELHPLVEVVPVLLGIRGVGLLAQVQVGGLQG
jgi:hypothetical protein